MPAQFFGLDIGRSFIKVVKVKEAGAKRTLEAAASLPTPNGGVMSESVVDLKKVAEGIRACVSKAGIDADRAVVSIIESQVVTRLIQLPNLTDKELSAAISWEAEQYIPLPIKDVNLQYKVISRPAGGGQMDVLLIAAPKRVIDKYLSIATDAGLTVAALETESVALARALTRAADPPTIIVSMGAVSTELVVVRDASVLFTRSVATGGVNLTRAIALEFNLPQNQAEEYKQTYGIQEDKLAGKVAAVLRPILDILVSEILKAIEFSKDHVGERSVQRLIITGGGAYMPGLSPYLAGSTSLEVSLGDAWADLVKEGLILKKAGAGGIFAVATGLALRS